MDSPLRILHVVVNMNRGGAETLIMNLYRNINRSKIQFDFLTCKPGVFDEEIIGLGGKIHRIPYITDVGHVGFKQHLKQFFHYHEQYKIIHSHMDKMSGFILKAAKQVNIPVRIAHSHNTESEGNFLAKAYKWYAGTYITNSATHLYACSNKAAHWLFGKQANDAHILKNGIETDKFTFSTHIRERIRDELHISKDTFVLGHVGRFSPQKNHLFLIEVFAEIRKEIPHTVLVLVGDGLLREEIKSKILELNLEEYVKLLGVRSDTHHLLQAFDLFMMPSLHEGLPVTLIEAQGAGLPCLISNEITREVDMGIGLVHDLAITNKQTWVEAVKAFYHIVKPSRGISQTSLSEKGYDIKETAKDTELTYLMLGEKA